MPIVLNGIEYIVVSDRFHRASTGACILLEFVKMLLEGALVAVRQLVAVGLKQLLKGWASLSATVLSRSARVAVLAAVVAVILRPCGASLGTR